MHPLQQEMENEIKEQVKGAAKEALRETQQHLSKRSTWIKKREEEKREPEVIQDEIYRAYDNANLERLQELSKQLQKFT